MWAFERWHFPRVSRILLPYKLFYLTLFSGLSSISPFLPVFFRMRGLSASQIGIFGFLKPMMNVLTMPVWSALADKMGLKKSILLLTTLGSAAVRLLYIFPPSFEAIAPLVVLANALGGAPPVLADAFTMDHLKDKTDYGKQRLWGAVGWGLGAPLSGMVVSSTGIESAFYLHAASPTGEIRSDGPGASAASQPSDRNGAQPSQPAANPQNHPNLSPPREPPTGEIRSDGPGASAASPPSDRNGAQPAANPQNHLNLPPPTTEDIPLLAKLAPLYRDPGVCSFFVIYAVMGLAMGMIEGFLPLRLSELGGSPTLIGLTLTVTCVAEVPMMWFSGGLIRTVGVRGVIYTALGCYVIRLAYYSLLWHLWAVLPIEVLHGVTFGCGWTAGTVHAGRISPPGLEATMQALFTGTYFGVGYASGMLLGGFVYQWYGAVFMFRSCAVFVAGSALVFGFSQRWYPLESKESQDPLLR